MSIDGTFQQFGKYYLPLVKAIYGYKNKSGINKFLEKAYLLSEKQNA